MPDLFRHEPHRDGDTRCVLCGKRFKRRSSNHGLMHVDRGDDVKMQISAYSHTYVFSVPEADELRGLSQPKEETP